MIKIRLMKSKILISDSVFSIFISSLIFNFLVIFIPIFCIFQNIFLRIGLSTDDSINYNVK